jgi:hypothetical protein
MFNILTRSQQAISATFTFIQNSGQSNQDFSEILIPTRTKLVPGRNSVWKKEDIADKLLMMTFSYCSTCYFMGV